MAKASSIDSSVGSKPLPECRRPKTCLFCAEIFASRNPMAKFCSRACKNESIRIHPKNDPRPCIVCSTIFKPERHNGNARFCSKKCIWIATKGPAFNAKVARETMAARGDALRGSGEGKSYRKLNGRHEHRIVAEKKAGRPLRFEDVVHHIDGNRLNNDPDNLEIMTRAEHMRAHGLGIPGVDSRKHRNK